MVRLWFILGCLLFFSSCGGSGVTVTKSQTVEYISNAFNKSKKWFRSTDGDSITEVGPPPPSHLQPTAQDVYQKRATQNKTNGMSKDDYRRAIKRLEKTLTDLKRQLGNKHIEVGETYQTIGSMNFILGNELEANKAYKKALDIFSHNLGAEHPRVWKLKDKIKKLN